MGLNTPLPDGWKWTTVGDIVSFEYGKGLTKSKRDSSGDVPVYGSNGVVGYHSVALVDKPCLIIGRKGAAGAIHKSENPCWPIDTTYFVIPPENIQLSFIYYLFSNLNLGSLDRSTAIPGLNRYDAYSQIIPLPPLDQQERIVEKIETLFSQLDAGVAALKRTQATLKRYRASVLKAAFEGKLVPQDPSDEPAEAALRRMGKAPLSGDDLPQLPVGWCWATVGELARNIQYGYTESASFEPVGPKFLRITDIQDGLVDWGKVPFCKINTFDYEKYKLSKDDIVFTRTGATTGKSYLIKENKNAVFASYLIRISLMDGIYTNYVYLFLDSPSYWGQIMSERKGSAQPGVNAKILSRIVIPFPPLNEQIRIVTEIDNRLSVVHELESSVKTNLLRAERLRQAVLKSAFIGRLT